MPRHTSTETLIFLDRKCEIQFLLGWGTLSLTAFNGSLSFSLAKLSRSNDCGVDF